MQTLQALLMWVRGTLLDSTETPLWHCLPFCCRPREMLSLFLLPFLVTRGRFFFFNFFVFFFTHLPFFFPPTCLDYTRQHGVHSGASPCHSSSGTLVFHFAVFPCLMRTRGSSSRSELGLVPSAPSSQQTSLWVLCARGPTRHLPFSLHCLVPQLYSSSALRSEASTLVLHCSRPGSEADPTAIFPATC